jgi:hypothetical protein
MEVFAFDASLDKESSVSCSRDGEPSIDRARMKKVLYGNNKGEARAFVEFEYAHYPTTANMLTMFK